MTRSSIFAVAAALLSAAPFAARCADTPPAASPSVATQTVDIMNKAWGRHAGYRANHAKGVVVQGTFTPSSAGPGLSVAPLFSSGTIPVTVRFSDATGLPDVADSSPPANPHGMAIRFKLPGRTVDLVTNSLAFFPVKNGEEFLQLLQATVASKDAPHPTPVEQFIGSHPRVVKALATVATPSSFAREQYNGIDAFIFVDAKGKRQPFRFAIVPAAGVEHVAEADAAKQPKDYLVTELPARLSRGPVAFHLTAVLAGPGDPTNDPTQPWPASRKSVDLGTITLTTPAQDNAAAQKALRFLPNNICRGIELSDDPLIDARVRAYVISFGRRAS